MSTLNQSVYFFGAGKADGNSKMKNTLGGKGANLAEMTSLGLPVPPGFTIPTEMCLKFFEDKEQLSEELKSNVLKSLSRVEDIMGKKFGGKENPLLLSVRSGARVSMPGMMDTILNLGLNDETVVVLAKLTGNERFAWDSYRRFLQMYSNVVMGMNISLLDIKMEDLKDSKGLEFDTELEVNDLKFLVSEFKKQIADTCGKDFPVDPFDQLWGAINAVFKSWNVSRAVAYREMNRISHNWGTAVNIQSMVFGNMGESSATGVAFTRNPSTGENKYYGEYLVNAQGEDVVAGIRTPQEIIKNSDKPNGESMEEKFPEVYKQLENIFIKLENHYRDMQDIEFTVEQGQLWMLQTRTGKRTAKAALKIAIEMNESGLISEDEALLRIDPQSLDQLLHPTLDPKAKKNQIAKGLPASPGGACGKVVFTSEEAVVAAEKGEKVILVRVETSPEDIEGMHAAEGILTSRGGMTSHAAVVARGMGKCCVAGCGAMEVDYVQRQFSVGSYVVKEGELITLDGSKGEVYLGKVKTIEPKLDEYFQKVMKLSDQRRRLKVRTNADTAKDANVAREFGAEGIGLCRTEHMFFDSDRIDVMRQMILSDNSIERKDALDKLLPMQRQDFYDLFKVMVDLPVTIRLLDPPLHEFLPHTEKEMEELSNRIDMPVSRLRSKIKPLEEFNPMLGHRGCRLAITYPEIYIMQARAISEAASDLIKEGQKLVPEIMIPLVGMAKELEILKKLVISEVEAVQKEKAVEFDYLVGTMIELPRAALTADEVAEHADFFSFGTNDLTQTCLGISRDDAGRFLSSYISEGVMPADPFASIDVKGVGGLVDTAVKLGRTNKKNLKIGICGEHGGDPESINFFNKTGLDYVSCSPFRVPIARLAAAQAVLKQK